MTAPCTHDNCPDDKCVLDGGWWFDNGESREIRQMFLAYLAVLRDFERYKRSVADYIGRSISRQRSGAEAEA